MALKRWKSNEGSGMRKVGMFSTGLGALSLAAVLGMVVLSLPELKRYLKMSSM